MRSSDLARLAGVTVRTLRHYHQIGVLPEPTRSSNGYRVYDTAALVTVLRIRRLVDLGFSLPQISTVLAGTEPPPDAVFDALDAEFAAQIDRLTRQREVLAHLRQHNAFPDLPPEIASYHDVLRRVGLPDGAAALDRDHTLLLMHLVGSDGSNHLATVYELLSHPDRAPAAAAAMTAWANLGGEATPVDIDMLVDRLTELFRPVVSDLAARDLPDLSLRPETWFQEYTKDYLTPAQQEVLERVRAALDTSSDEGP